MKYQKALHFKLKKIIRRKFELKTTEMLEKNDDGNMTTKIWRLEVAKFTTPDKAF